MALKDRVDDPRRPTALARWLTPMLVVCWGRLLLGHAGSQVWPPAFLAGTALGLIGIARHLFRHHNNQTQPRRDESATHSRRQG